MLNLLLTAGVASLLGTSVALETPDQVTDYQRLSSSEIGQMLGEKSNLPPNCEAFYFPDPVTGELICSAVVCTSSGGWKEIFECSEFGL